MDDYNWIIWLLIALTGFFTVTGGLMMISPDQETKREGQKILYGWWGGVAAIAATTLALTFVIKPVLAWFFGLF